MSVEGNTLMIGVTYSPLLVEHSAKTTSRAFVLLYTFMFVNYLHFEASDQLTSNVERTIRLIA